MKTTVVPAQITTVEDKIAGSLTFQQIILLVMSLIIGTAIYLLVPPKLHVSAIKAALMLIQFALLGILAIRISGKILAEWLVVYLRYSLRPRVYIFKKSDLAQREVILPIFERAKKESAITIKSAAKQKKRQLPESNLDLKNWLSKPDSSLSVKPAKKGGLDVVFQKLE